MGTELLVYAIVMEAIEAKLRGEDGDQVAKALIDTVTELFGKKYVGLAIGLLEATATWVHDEFEKQLALRERQIAAWEKYSSPLSDIREDLP